MNLTMLDGGSSALARAQQNRDRLVISHFALGGASNYPVLPSAVGFRTPILYKNRIDAQTVSGDTAVFTCILPASLALAFGELAVLSPDGGFVGMATLVTPIMKTAGTEMQLTLQLSSSNLGQQLLFQSNKVFLSRTRPDFDDALLQLQAAAADRPSFKGLVTNETGNTLLELMAGVVDLDSYMFESALQEGFPDTAKLDSSQYAAQIMLGNRLTRKEPAGTTCTLVRTGSMAARTIPAYTQWTAGAKNLFNRNAITFLAGQTQVNTQLFEGEVIQATVSGRGEDYQMWISQHRDFEVSDKDVRVSLNTQRIAVVYDAMWNYPGAAAVQDRTDKDGALRLFFGNATLGTRPAVTDVLNIVYVVTQGNLGNDAAFAGQKIQSSGWPGYEATASTPLTGGGDQPSTVLYQRLGGDIYGGQRGCVIPTQYRAVARNYPGVIDAVVLAQRDLAPMNKDWFNVGKIILLTQSPWTQADKVKYEEWFRARTMYSMRYQIQTGTEGDTEPKPKPIGVRARLGCLPDTDLNDIQSKAEGAARKFFIPRAGILSRDVFMEDLTAAMRAVAPEQIDYIELELPTEDIRMDIYAPRNIGVEITEGEGTIPPGTYVYGVASYDADGVTPPTEVKVTLTAPMSKVKFTWTAVPAALGYIVYGRTTMSLGELQTLPGLEWEDDGTEAGTGVPPVPINTSGVHYAQLENLDVTAVYSRRRSIEDTGYGRS